eukprot:572169-Hanusia_phi.AAC.1
MQPGEFLEQARGRDFAKDLGEAKLHQVSLDKRRRRGGRRREEEEEGGGGGGRRRRRFQFPPPRRKYVPDEKQTEAKCLYESKHSSERIVS